MEIYNYNSNYNDILNITREESEMFDFSPYLGSSIATSNLYKLYILDGYTPLQAAIMVLETVVANVDH